MEGAHAAAAQDSERGGARSKPSTMATADSRPPCRFHLLGKCKFGESCTFSHDPRGRLPVCSFFEKNGSCRYGKDCKFLHGSNDSSEGGALGARSAAGAGHGGARGAWAGRGAEEEGAQASADSAEQEEPEAVELDAGDNCGICLENIPASGKRFGLLNCDHVYCLECLRTWRKSKGPQKDISRTCPECRKVSFFLVPSKDHLKGKEKTKAIQEYKKGLSKLPCKYHKANGSSSCPFGSRCFYAHLDENGADVKDRVPPPAAASSSRRTCPYMRNGAEARSRELVEHEWARMHRAMYGLSLVDDSDWDEMEYVVSVGEMGVLAQLERVINGL